MQRLMLCDSEASVKLVQAFKKTHKGVANRVSWLLGRTACRIEDKRLLNKALQMRKEHAGSLPKSTRLIKSLQIKGSEDFGVGCHTAPSAPYFYDSAHQLVKRDYAIPINEQGKCIVAKVIKTDSPTGTTTQWGCSRECKPVTPQEIETIVGFKEAFEKPMHELRVLSRIAINILSPYMQSPCPQGTRGYLAFTPLVHPVP